MYGGAYFWNFTVANIGGERCGWWWSEVVVGEV